MSWTWGRQPTASTSSAPRHEPRRPAGPPPGPITFIPSSHLVSEAHDNATLAFNELNYFHPGPDFLDNYVPFSELEPPDQVASLLQQQKDLKSQHVAQIKALCEKIAEEKRRFQCIYNGMGDWENATSMRDEMTIKRLANCDNTRLHAFRTHQLAKVAEVHNAEMKDLQKRIAQAKKELEVWEHSVKFDFPSTPRQFEAQMEADSPHASQVAKYLVATDDTTRKFIIEYAKQAGRVWSEERIQRMLEHYNDNAEFQQRVQEIAKSAPAPSS